MRPTAWLAAALIAIALSTPVEAQQHADDPWNAVLALPAGTDLEIRIAEGLVDARLREVHDDRIALVAEGQMLDIRRDEIIRIVVIGDRQTGRYARRGFLIGAAFGAVQTALVIKSHRAEWLLILSGARGAFGAAMGALDGARTRKRTVIYDVARRRR